MVSARLLIDAVVSLLMAVTPVMPIIIVVIVTVPLPVLHMAGGHVYVDRPGNDHGCGPAHNRMRVNDRRREIADVQVKARLADAYGHAHVGCVCCVSCSVPFPSVESFRLHSSNR
jgi:hypothetical protein